MLSVGDVSARLGIPWWRIDAAYRRFDLPEPKQRFAGKRIFTEDDVKLIKDYFAARGGKWLRKNPKYL